VATSTHTLTIPSSTRFLEDVREFVSMHAADAGFDDMVVEQLKMAVDEACTNVIEHAYAGQNEQPIDIAIILNTDKLTIRIRDKGQTFNQQAYREPDLIEYAKTRKSGGFGVHIMRRLMDEVAYKTSGGYNECRMVKYRS